ncbi:hypothetical protein BKA59DRAFT_515502 [Fusarium tricinctum]|uniref:Uncharacterized protein n=1 Tax=Fusarium tricinctum TaxID=61284 RepID=A0A8K0RS35_9HYPO|nr:hypothetical protein BKA59DRAFT_515502 [Fusarium tricinctum]
MHSAIFALVAITGLVSAGPTAQQTECQGVGQFYVCANNGFRGWCSNDPCNKKWCSDFVEKTCKPVFTTESKPKTSDECQGVGQFYVCANNGFRGYCSNDPCDKKWCSDFVEETCKPVSITESKPKTSDECQAEVTENPAVLPEEPCAPGTGFFQVCSNGFRGCCKFDACSSKKPICPNHNSKRTDDTVCAPGTGFFQNCSNGFRGCCKTDACTGTAGVCPDAKTKTDDKHAEPETWENEPVETEVTANPAVLPDGQCAPETGFFQVCSNGFRGCCKFDACSGKAPVCPTKNTKRNADPTVCPPGTGFFQSCSNGFRGCCKSDACSQAQPICPTTVSKRQADPTVCPPGTGFFQSCSNGFRGCCKGDACSGSWCPDTQTFQVKVRSATAASADGTCRPGTGFFQVCSNGFKGCCKKDACAGKRPVCPK